MISAIISSPSAAPQRPGSLPPQAAPSRSEGTAAAKNTQLPGNSALAAAGAAPASLLAPDTALALFQAGESNPSSAFDDELTPEEQKQVQELRQRDAEVRAHEAAHKTAGGPVAGNVTFETVTGPDGREYAVAGEVQIDASPVPNNPEATIRKMDLVIRAALAPAEPSPQDRAVAAQAQQTRLQARQEAAELREREAEERTDSSNNNNGLNVTGRQGDLQNGESGVNTIRSREGDSDPDAEIISILFGNSRV